MMFHTFFGVSLYCPRQLLVVIYPKFGGQYLKPDDAVIVEGVQNLSGTNMGILLEFFYSNIIG